MADKHTRALARTELELRRCRRSARYTIEQYIRIEDRDSPDLVTPFHLWPAQAEVLERFVSERLNIVLKARQLGLTWLALSYAVWRIVFQSGYAVVALSKREEDAKELTRRVCFILRHLPAWMVRERKQAPAGYNGPVWEATTLTVSISHPGAEPATFTSMSSGPESGRSFTASLVLLDEWAFQQWAHEIWAAAYPTVNRPTGGQVIGLSTAARGTLFEEIWDAARDGRNGFTTSFLPWSADPRRTDTWYEQTRRDLSDTYHAEYPETPEEAFLYSGLSVFNVEIVLERVRQLREVYRDNPPLRCMLTSDLTAAGEPVRGTSRMTQDASGWLTVYAEPRPRHPYVIGADTAEGGIDYSVAQVIDNVTGEQVAVWRGRCDLDLFAVELFRLGWLYNEALIAVECNFDSYPVRELQRLGYLRQYKQVQFDDISQPKQHKFGFRTTQSNREPMISSLISLVRETPECIVDLDTLDEMLTFVRNEKNNRPEAQPGKHDDCVMSLAIAHMARSQQSSKPGAEKTVLRGVYAYGELLMMGYKDYQIRQMERAGGLKVIGKRGRG